MSVRPRDERHERGETSTITSNGGRGEERKTGSACSRRREGEKKGQKEEGRRIRHDGSQTNKHTNDMHLGTLNVFPCLGGVCVSLALRSRLIGRSPSHPTNANVPPAVSPMHMRSYVCVWCGACTYVFGV